MDSKDAEIENLKIRVSVLETFVNELVTYGCIVSFTEGDYYSVRDRIMKKAKGSKQVGKIDDEAEIELPPVAEPKPGDIIFDKVRM